MDNQEKPNTTDNQPAGTTPPAAQPAEPAQPTPTKRPRQGSRTGVLVALLILLLLVAGAGAYWWRDKEAKESVNARQAEITALKRQVSDLTTAAGETKDEAATTAVTAAAKTETITSAIKSGNTAALEGYMADSVNVILAASEAYGPQTPAEAVADLAYLNDATDPWDFELTAATLAGYRSGDYGSYFPVGAVVGKSANSYVVTFTFDAAGDINGIFMTNSAEVL